MLRFVATLLLTFLVTACASTQCDMPIAIDVAPGPKTSVSEVRPSRNLKDVEQLIQTLPEETTLVVFDIDDTMLTATAEPPQEHFFGSDRWFRWQMDLPNDDREKIRCLLEDVLALDYEAARLRPTQPDAGEIFNRIPNDKLFLTSRSPNYRGGTERELRNIGVALPALIPGKEPILLEYVHGNSRRPMSYVNGIFMTSGVDKGKALMQLLGDDRRYKTVVLVDDGGKNIYKMKDALALEDIDYYGLRYDLIKLDPFPEPLPPVTQAQIDESRVAMTRWLVFMRDLYPERYEVLNSTCGYFPIDESAH